MPFEKICATVEMFSSAIDELKSNTQVKKLLLLHCERKVSEYKAIVKPVEERLRKRRSMYEKAFSLAEKLFGKQIGVMKMLPSTVMQAPNPQISRLEASADVQANGLGSNHLPHTSANF